MLQARSDIDTTEILENWGRWAGGNAFSSLCYPSIEPFRRLYSLPGETARVRPPLDTDMAERADKVMASLIKRDEQNRGGDRTVFYDRHVLFRAGRSFGQKNQRKLQPVTSL